MIRMNMTKFKKKDITQSGVTENTIIYEISHLMKKYFNFNKNKKL